jgi:hypothetical protein
MAPGQLGAIYYGGTMIQYHLKSDNLNLKIATSLTSSFFEQLSVKDLPEYFNHTDHSPAQVVEQINIYTGSQFTVEEYKPWNRFTKAIGHAQYPKIYVNYYKMDKMFASDFVQLLAHETMHLIGYKHKGNYVTQYNLKTVPYVIGSLAEAWVKGHQ